DQGLENVRGDRRARQSARAAFVSAARRRRRSTAMSQLRQGPAVTQAEQVRRFYRLLQLSGMPLNAAALDPRRWFGRYRHQGPRPGSRVWPRSDAAQRSLRPLFAAWRSGQWRETAPRWAAERNRA